MPRKRKKKNKYDPVQTLQPKTLRSDVEQLARDLYGLACCGSESIWGELEGPKTLIANPVLKEKFLTSAQNGMVEAQKKIADHLISGEEVTDSHEVLYRGIADSIAWQLIGQQLCYARRFYKGHRQPSLDNCNFESVIMAADYHIAQNPGSVALISDLMSFVQIGDLLTMSSDGRFGIIEVKEGKKNRAISEFLEFYLGSGCERSLYYFAQQEGIESVKQMGRMMRQVQRMSHVSEVMSKGSSQDPDEKISVVIPDDFIVINTWEEELVYAVDEANEKGWSIQVIDDCLFLGCYTEGPMKMAGHIAFNGWFDQCGGTPNCPRATLLDSMTHPLALPIFNLNLPSEIKFDVLFGRKQICIGFNVGSFLSQCRKAKLSVRFATNKEASKADQTGIRPYRHNGKAIFIGDGNSELLLMDGVFLRAIHHMQRPISLIKAILANATQEPPNKKGGEDAK